MRPTRLELSGFTVYREPIEIDFRDADLFALTGPIGSGKSSIIDAMTFALYGAVPRFGDRRAVAPVITQGKQEARVRFDFTVDERPYSAVRIVRRTGRGAATKEARLERDGEVLAGGAAEVGEEIEKLLGLGFDHFTTCVVLPQGDFARFLHAKRADRQELLRQLLGAEVYKEMSSRANQLGAAAEGQAKIVESQLQELHGVDDEAKAHAQHRLRELTDLLETIDASAPRLAGMVDERERAASEARQLEQAGQLLSDLAVPKEVDELAKVIALAERQVEEAEQLAARRVKALAGAQAARAALGDREPLEIAHRAHTEYREEAAALEAAEEVLGNARAAAVMTAEAVAAASVSAEDAAESLTASRRAHAAHDLARHLVGGRPCPVCGQTVDDPPEVDAAEDLEEAARRDADTGERLRAAQDEHRAAEHGRVEAETRVKDLRHRLEQRAEGFAEHPDFEGLELLLKEISQADGAVSAATTAEQDARRALDEAENRLTRLVADEQSARKEYEQIRDRLAAQEPPSPDRVDLAADWHQLVDWARQRRPELIESGRQAAARAAQVAQEREALNRRLEEACRRHHVDTDGRDLRDACFEATSGARIHLQRINDDLSKAAELRAQRELLTKEGRVARDLARQLGIRQFESWLLREALEQLVHGANRVLRELSGGQYSLVVDDENNFQVVDHHNADEERSAKTLSGGETFLASLALALSLADGLIEMATLGTAGFESIFLDEGFGTLDEETLEVVSSIIRELGATGRTVGVVTHVRALADELPVRFEVTKDLRTARVMRKES